MIKTTKWDIYYYNSLNKSINKKYKKKEKEM